MEFGLILPSYRAGASVESIDATSAAAARLGWGSVFTTDHLLVDPGKRSEDYFNVFEAVLTTVHVAAKQPSLRVGVSVIVVPMRNAVQLAKELATIDALSGGRLIAGVGVGWNKVEFGNLGLADRFQQRGAYLDEAIAVWRHLWSGNEGPFKGRFHSFDEVRFAPLPVQGADLPVWVGGRDERGLRRAGRLGQAYHSSRPGHAELAVRIPIIRAAAEEAGRPMPLVSARVRVQFGPSEAPFYMLAGTPEQMIAEIRAFEEVGTGHHRLRLRRDGSGQGRAADGALRRRGPVGSSDERPGQAGQRSPAHRSPNPRPRAPPTADELAAIERQRIDWAALLGAEVVEAGALGTLVDASRPAARASTSWPASAGRPRRSPRVWRRSSIGCAQRARGRRSSSVTACRSRSTSPPG